jgi:hypothetical protein
VQSRHLQVVNYLGPSHVAIQKVPCSVSGSIVLGLVTYGAPLSPGNFYATALNHRLGITQMWFRPTTTANWFGLVCFVLVLSEKRYLGIGFHAMK